MFVLLRVVYVDDITDMLWAPFYSVVEVGSRHVCAPFASSLMQVLMLPHHATPWQRDSHAFPRGNSRHRNLSLRMRRRVPCPRTKHLPPSLGSGDFRMVKGIVEEPKPLVHTLRCTSFVQAHREEGNESRAGAIASSPSLGSNGCVAGIDNDASIGTSLPSLGSSQMDATNVANDSVDAPMPCCDGSERDDDNSASALPFFCSVQLDAMNTGHHIGETSLSSLGSSGQQDTSHDSPVRRAVGLPAKARKMLTWERWFLALVLLCATLMDRTHENLAQHSKDYIRDTAMFDYMSGQD